MLETSLSSWTLLLLLGALHGINPGMGWLFAVALGLQQQNGRVVWCALLPLAIGHGAAIVTALGVAVAAGVVLDPQSLRWVVASLLFGMGIFQLRRHRHPRWAGMRVRMRDLAIWSFLMASAHGAGLMALPFIPAAAPPIAEIRTSPLHAAPASEGRSRAASGAAQLLFHPPAASHPHAAHVPPSKEGGTWLGLLATLIHTAGYLVATGAIAAIVYYRLGLRFLQRAWINLDTMWAGALIATAVLTLLI